GRRARGGLRLPRAWWTRLSRGGRRWCRPSCRASARSCVHRHVLDEVAGPMDEVVLHVGADAVPDAVGQLGDAVPPVLHGGGVEGVVDCRVDLLDGERVVAREFGAPGLVVAVAGHRSAFRSVWLTPIV